MKKRYAVFISCYVMMCMQAIAQLKQLTTAQYWKNDHAGLENELPKVVRWIDDAHYVLAKPLGDSKYDSVITDVATSAEQKYSLLNETTVYVQNNDVFYRSHGDIKQLTNTVDKEKNPTLSPDSATVAFTRNNDLYIININSGKETRLTTDGSDTIYNGYASWLYYEEILGRPTKYKAFWWSPDSKRIAYMRFDDSDVPVFPIYHEDSLSTGYIENTRYPLPGDTNPSVRIGIVNIESLNTTFADFSEKDDQYFGTPFWTPDSKKLFVQWMNRKQDNIIIYAVDPISGLRTSVYDELQKTWVDWFEDIKFLPNNKGFILQSDKSGWTHIYYYAMNGTLMRQLTNGNWNVKTTLRVDAAKNLVYFTARKEASTRYDLYSVSLNGRNMKRLTFGNYTHTIDASPTGNYFLTTYSNDTVPLRLALFDSKGKLIKQIADSKGSELNNYALAKTQHIRVKVDSFDLPVSIVYPLNMDSTKKYPVLISVYGGPNAGNVFEGWNWTTFSATQWWAKEGLIQVAIDHRGSGHFGKTGQNFMYHDLGNWEIHDYSEVVKWLETKPFIDQEKICITGFSYGGYTTCMALTRGADIFTHGIAGGSVTDWYLYDSHYTEKYMGTPMDNPQGYKSGAVATYINNYKGNLYIIHGTADDNVHMQNSLRLISDLENAGKHFEFMVYPGGRHGWGSLKEKNIHFSNEKTRYYYQYLLQKPLPAEALQ